MTKTESLSTRIATLEAQAAPLPLLNTELAAVIERSNEISALIQDAVRAAKLLEELRGFAERLFSSGEALNPESIPVNAEQNNVIQPQSEEPQTPTSTENEWIDSALETMSNFVNSPSNPEAAVDSPEQPVAPPPALAPAEEEPEELSPYVSQEERCAAWVVTLDETSVIDAAHAAEELSFSKSSCGKYLAAAVDAGLLERVPGTGLPGSPSNPSKYRRPRPQVDLISPAPETSPPRSKAPAPAPTPLTEPPDPRPAARAEAHCRTRSSAVELELVLGCLKKQGRPMSKTLMIGRLASRGIKSGTLADALAQLEAQGLIELSAPGQYALAQNKAAE